MRCLFIRWIGLVVVLGLFACQSAPAPITFMVFGEPAEIAAYQQLATAYMQANPTDTVELVVVPSQSAYRDRVAVDLNAGIPSDIVLLNYRRVPAFASQGQLLPLTQRLAQSTHIAASDFYSATLPPFTWQGELMCIPLNISSLVVYYNRDLFQAAGVPEPAPGWNWDDFVATAKALTLDTNGDGTPDQYGLVTDIELQRLAPFIWQVQGGALVFADGRPGLALNTFAASEAYEWFTGLQTVHGVAPNRVADLAENAEARFLNGRAAMWLQSRRVTTNLRAVAQFNWDVSPLPQKDQPATVLHSDGYCIPTAAKNPEGAWRFIQFASTAQGQTLLAATGRSVPSRPDVAASPAFLDPTLPPRRAREAWLDTAPHTYALPLQVHWSEIESIAGEELKRAFYGEAEPLTAISATLLRTTEYFPLP